MGSVKLFYYISELGKIGYNSHTSGVFFYLSVPLTLSVFLNVVS